MGGKFASTRLGNRHGRCRSGAARCGQSLGRRVRWRGRSSYLAVACPKEPSGDGRRYRHTRGRRADPARALSARRSQRAGCRWGPATRNSHTDPALQPQARHAWCSAGQSAGSRGRPSRRRSWRPAAGSAGPDRERPRSCLYIRASWPICGRRVLPDCGRWRAAYETPPIARGLRGAAPRLELRPASSKADLKRNRTLPQPGSRCIRARMCDGDPRQTGRGLHA